MQGIILKTTAGRETTGISITRLIATIANTTAVQQAGRRGAKKVGASGVYRLADTIIDEIGTGTVRNTTAGSGATNGMVTSQPIDREHPFIR